MKYLLISLVLLSGLSNALADETFQPSRYVDVDGVSVAVYESSGRGSPVLLVHGNTSSAQAFQRTFALPFARLHHVVALDMPGYGNSENAAAYSVGLLTDAVAAVAEATGADDGIIVGWSLGGDIALQTLAKLPNIKGAFLVGTAPVGYDPSLPAPFLTPEESYAGAAVNFGFVGGITPEMVDAYVTAFFRPNYSPIPQFFYTAGERTDPATRDAVATAASGLDPTFADELSIVRNATIPIAMVIGDSDAFVNPEFMFALEDSVPTLWRHNVVLVPQTGHAVQWERPVVFDALLEAFIVDTKLHRRR